MLTSCSDTTNLMIRWQIQLQSNVDLIVLLHRCYHMAHGSQISNWVHGLHGWVYVNQADILCSQVREPNRLIWIPPINSDLERKSTVWYGATNFTQTPKNNKNEFWNCHLAMLGRVAKPIFTSLCPGQPLRVWLCEWILGFKKWNRLRPIGH